MPDGLEIGHSGGMLGECPDARQFSFPLERFVRPALKLLLALPLDLGMLRGSRYASVSRNVEVAFFGSREHDEPRKCPIHILHYKPFERGVGSQV
jgi:hypothetical protein